MLCYWKRGREAYYTTLLRWSSRKRTAGSNPVASAEDTPDLAHRGLPRGSTPRTVLLTGWDWRNLLSKTDGRSQVVLWDWK